jgi:rRNA maturation endonuclease Nob1
MYVAGTEIVFIVLLLLIIGVCIYFFVRAKNKKQQGSKTQEDVFYTCPRCGKSIEQDAQFCENCGNKLG